LPAICPTREFVEIGGLIAYGFDLPDAWRHGADEIDQILRGRKPSDIPGSNRRLPRSAARSLRVVDGDQHGGRRKVFLGNRDGKVSFCPMYRPPSRRADVSFDYFVGDREQSRRYAETESGPFWPCNQPGHVRPGRNGSMLKTARRFTAVVLRYHVKLWI
jgi:hypothetical protein